MTTATLRPTLPGALSVTGTDADVTASAQAFANRASAHVAVMRQTDGAARLVPFRTREGAEDATPRGTRVTIVSPATTAPMPWAVRVTWPQAAPVTLRYVTREQARQGAARLRGQGATSARVSKA